MKLFLFLLPVGILFAGGVLFFSTRQAKVAGPCACDPSIAETTGEFDPEAGEPIFNNKPIRVKMAELMPSLEALNQQEGIVLGKQSEERWIEIDLSEQKLFAHNGQEIDYEFFISSGKNWTPTVTGEFRVWSKFKYAKMSGGTPGTSSYYYLPNVPYIQYFHNDYAFHGAYWHNNFGQQMSHGCVNLSIADAEKLFYWTSPPLPPGKTLTRPSKDFPGTRVLVHK